MDGRRGTRHDIYLWRVVFVDKRCQQRQSSSCVGKCQNRQLRNKRDQYREGAPTLNGNKSVTNGAQAFAKTGNHRRFQPSKVRKATAQLAICCGAPANVTVHTSFLPAYDHLKRYFSCLKRALHIQTRQSQRCAGDLHLRTGVTDEAAVAAASDHLLLLFLQVRVTRPE